MENNKKDTGKCDPAQHKYVTTVIGDKIIYNSFMGADKFGSNNETIERKIFGDVYPQSVTICEKCGDILDTSILDKKNK